MPVWRRGTSFCDFGGPNFDPKWQDDKIVFDEKHFQPKGELLFKELNEIKYKSDLFMNIAVRVGPLPANSLEEQRTNWINNSALEYTLEIPKTIREDSWSVKGDDSPYFAISKNQSLGGVSILMPTSNNKLIQINLSSMTSHVWGQFPRPLDGLGVFNDGSAYARSGQNVYIYRENGFICKINVKNLSQNALASFSGEKLYFASSHVGRQPIFEITGISSKGSIMPEELNLNKNILPDDPAPGEKEYDFSFDSERHSISIMSSSTIILSKSNMEFLDAPAHEFSSWWCEFDWSSGQIISPIIENSGFMWGAGAAFYGQSPSDWLVASYSSRDSSGASNRIYLKRIEKIGTDEKYDLGTSENSIRGSKPLIAMETKSKDSIIVLSSGNRGAQIEELSLLTGNIRLLHQFRWDNHEGDRAFFVSGKNWVIVPNDMGYAMLEIDTNRKSTEQIARIFVGKGNEFSIMLTSGIFSGSPGCENLLSSKGVDGYVISPWRNRPAEVLKTLGGDPAQIEALSRVTERWLKKLGNPERNPEPTAADIPTLTLANDVPLWAKQEQVDLKFEAKPGTAPVKDVVVRVNGVAQHPGNNCADGGSRIERSIKLAEGQNWIEAVAVDNKGRSSNLLRFRTILPKASTPAKRFIIAMGVSKYRDNSMNLEFAAKDATDLSNAIKACTPGPSDVLLLTNEQVTRESLDKIRSFLANAREKDEVVAFCAGHGVLDSNLDYVYASHEFDSANPSATGIQLDDLVDAVGSSKALKRLLLLDTCHAGQVGEKEEMLLAQMDTNLPSGVRAVKQRGMSVKPVSGLSAEGRQRFIEEMFLLPGLHRGINIIGASGGAEFALESEKWNNGVFTATIIEALRDKKADLNGDTRISVSELRDFLAQRVSELTKGAQKPSVVASERDQDFDLIRASNKTP